jgi:3-dehydroquinate dehydratase
MESSTFLRVSGCTDTAPLITRETVIGDTSQWLATSRMVTIVPPAYSHCSFALDDFIIAYRHQVIGCYVIKHAKIAKNEHKTSETMHVLQNGALVSEEI